MNAPLILLFTLASLAIDVASSAILTLVYRKLIAAGKSPVLPLSVEPAKLRMAALAEKRGFLALFANVALFWPFLEETVFRLAPYLAAGLAGALVGTIAWALSHYTKIYAENSHLEPRDFTLLAGAYLGSIAASGVIYTIGMHATGELWLPYFLHFLHNATVLLSLRQAAMSVPKHGFIKQREPVKRKATTAVKTAKWVGGIRWEYLE